MRTPFYKFYVRNNDKESLEPIYYHDKKKAIDYATSFSKHFLELSDTDSTWEDGATTDELVLYKYLINGENTIEIAVRLTYLDIC